MISWSDVISDFIVFNILKIQVFIKGDDQLFGSGLREAFTDTARLSEKNFFVYEAVKYQLLITCSAGSKTLTTPPGSLRSDGACIHSGL